MKLVTYTHGTSGPRAGIVVDGEIIDIGRASGGAMPTSMGKLLRHRDWHTELERSVAGAPADHRVEDVRLHAPVPHPGKILAAAGNYQAHIDEGGGGQVDTTRRTPRLFSKPPTSLLGHDEPLVLPAISDEVDWELELAIVIGWQGRDIAVEEALDHVAGYTIINDISARSMSWGIADREVHDWDRFFDWLVGKWIDGFAPAGPWMVTADEIADPQALSLRLEVSGETWQEASTGGMIFSCAELIAFASRITSLEPGDIIATGTPAGVGVAKGRFLVPSDVMVGTIEGIGTLRTPVRAS